MLQPDPLSLLSLIMAHVSALTFVLHCALPSAHLQMVRALQGGCLSQFQGRDHSLAREDDFSSVFLYLYDLVCFKCAALFVVPEAPLRQGSYCPEVLRSRRDDRQGKHDAADQFSRHLTNVYFHFSEAQHCQIRSYGSAPLSPFTRQAKVACSSHPCRCEEATMWRRHSLRTAPMACLRDGLQNARLTRYPARSPSRAAVPLRG